MANTTNPFKWRVTYEYRFWYNSTLKSPRRQFVWRKADYCQCSTHASALQALRNCRKRGYHKARIEPIR